MKQETGPTEQTREALVVLGMHRSGTSALAGLLAQLGCATPTALAPADENNTRGYFESIPIWRLSEDMLEAAGSSWDDWAPADPARFEAGEMAQFVKRAQFLLEREFPDAARFVLKDPRMCRLLPFWLEQIEAHGCAPILVLTHRHPAEVAASLNRRNGLDAAFGDLVWLRYVLEAERNTRDRRRVFVSYARLLSDWRAGVARIDAAHGTGLGETSGEGAQRADEFLAGDMRHFQSPDAAALTGRPWMRMVYDILERWAEHGEDSADFPQLDTIRGELDRAWTVLGPLSGQSKVDTGPGQQKDGLKAGLAAAQADMAGLRRSLAAQELELAGLTGKLQARTAETTELNRSLKRADAELSDKRRRLYSLKARADALEHAYVSTLESSSWKITAPLRRVMNLLRRQRP